MPRLIVFILFFVLSTSALAAEEDAANDDNNMVQKNQQEKPVRPDDDAVDPFENAEVNIIKREDRKIEIYRINGRIFKVKIIPTRGVPYFLFDTDGDGTLETRSHHDLHDINVNQWKIYSW